MLFNLYSATEILKLYQKTKSYQLDLVFKENPESIQFVKGELAYVGVVLLRDYYSFIVNKSGNIREHIFESNVRHYQGNVDVNKKIEETLISDYDRDFWWLNNGITLIAENCGQVAKTLTLDNVQIVNGLQTSYIIGRQEAARNDDKRSILVKVIVTKDKETIDKVVFATNNQTPVSHYMLRARDEIQRGIEFFFLNEGFYYDRRKNYYRNHNKPISKIFSIQNAAQAIHSIINFSPAAARSKPTTIIKDDKTYEAIFNRSTDFRSYLNCCLIHQRVKNYQKTELPSDSDEKNFGRNFVYHISRTVVTIITGKSKYSADDIASLDLDLVDNTAIGTSLGLVLRILDIYQKDHPDENVINIAKSAKFSYALNGALNSKFS